LWTDLLRLTAVTQPSDGSAKGATHHWFKINSYTTPNNFRALWFAISFALLPTSHTTLILAIAMISAALLFFIYTTAFMCIPRYAIGIFMPVL
jgi:hypothetical protein